MEIIFTAFVMGLLGAGHCVAMCGSLTMAVSFSIPANKNFFSYALFMSIGRILGYTLVGAVVSFVSLSVVSITSGGIYYLTILSAVLMLGVGLHVANLNSWVLKTEAIGKFTNRVIEPLKKNIMPINTVTKCLAYGFLWGFLPCGMVYTALTLALSASSVLNAAAVMLFFGLGTLPTLVGLTAFQSKLNSIFTQSYVRFGLGSIIIVLAALQFHKAISNLSALGNIG